RWRLSRSIDSRMEKKVLRSADKVITISKAVSHDLNEIRQKNDTIVIYNGYDSADFKPVTRGGRSEKRSSPTRAFCPIRGYPIFFFKSYPKILTSHSVRLNSIFMAIPRQVLKKSSGKRSWNTASSITDTSTTQISSATCRCRMRF